MERTRLELLFDQELLQNAEQARILCGSPVTRFVRSVQTTGGVSAVRELCRRNRPSDAFDSLAQAGRLDLSAEASAVKGKYGPLFTDDEVNACLALLLEAGYTEEDLIQDNAEFGVTSAAVNRPYFTVVLQYTLNEDGFTLAVPAERLQFSDDYPLYSLTLLENFGRLERSEEGFLLIPDGSGALIHFDKDNVKREKASVAVFGEDLTVTTTAKLAQHAARMKIPSPLSCRWPWVPISPASSPPPLPPVSSSPP